MLGVAFAASACLAGPAQATTRIALVIGNSAYENVAKLPNPVKDATAIATAFKQAHFDSVMLRENLGRAELRKALHEFLEAATRADIAVLYYAGHGIQMDGVNYIIPTDARLATDFDVDDEAISVDRILGALQPVRQLRMILLDACRDNPFEKTMKRRVALRAVERGLAKMEPPVNDTVIAYAAKAGSTAEDGSGEHSPFTTALIKYLLEPGLDVRLAFGRIRDDVLAQTGSRQEPYVYSSLGGRIVALVPSAAQSKAPPAADPNAGMRTDYQLAERVGTKTAWDDFLAVHPNGFYANLARAQRAKFEQAHPAAGKPAAEKLAAVNPAPEPSLAPPPTARVAALPPDLARRLQAELKRVGCDLGGSDGEWGDDSRRALDRFNRYAKTKLDTKVASLDALESVHAFDKRVCPCVSGSVLGADGVCHAEKRRPKAAKRSAHKSGGSRCLSVGGHQVCQ
jgi:Caspase domain